MKDRISLEDFRKLPQENKKGRNRYGNRKKEDKPTKDGFIFDSYPEIRRYSELKILVMAGEIRDLKVQPSFVLKEKSVNKHGQIIPKWTYKADFSYFNMKDIYHVEDVKSLKIVKENEKTNKYGTATERGYILSKNEFMRTYPDIKFVETIY